MNVLMYKRVSRRPRGVPSAWPTILQKKKYNEQCAIIND